MRRIFNKIVDESFNMVQHPNAPTIEKNRTNMRGQYSGRLCFRCMENVQLEDSVFITKSAVYHLKCFGCYKCNRVLNDKEEFYGIIDNIIYCQTHYQDLAANYAALFPPPPLLPVETTHTPLAFTQIKIEEDNITADQRKAEWKKLFPSINESTPTGESYSPNMDDRFLQRRWRNPNDNLDFMKRTKVKEELEVDGGRLMSIEGKRVSSRDLNVVNFNTNHSQITSVSHGSAKCAKPYVGGYVKENRQLQTYLNNPLNKHSVEHKGRKAKRDGLPKNKLNPESNLVVAFKKEKCGRRTRTSFKKHQLCVMQHHFFNFGHTPNPTELERLSHKTGLDKRVLQIWFQNTRAKWRQGEFPLGRNHKTYCNCLQCTKTVYDHTKSDHLITSDCAIRNH